MTGHGSSPSSTAGPTRYINGGSRKHSAPGMLADGRDQRPLYPTGLSAPGEAASESEQITHLHEDLLADGEGRHTGMLNWCL